MFVAFAAVCGSSVAHKYKSGECPQVEPMQGFDVRKVSGSAKAKEMSEAWLKLI